MKNDVMKLGWLVAAALILLPGMGRAETSPISETKMSIGPRATYRKLHNSDSKWYPGAQLRLHMGDALALEGSADYYKQTMNDLTNTEVKVYPIQATLLAYLTPQSPVSPFLLGGAGWYLTQVTGPGNFDDTQQRFGWHAGGGLELKFNKSLSLDSSYRYIWVEDIQSRDQNLLDKNYNDNGYMVTIGLNINF
jgi:opacity protein-like surface antigen